MVESPFEISANFDSVVSDGQIGVSELDIFLMFGQMLAILRKVVHEWRADALQIRRVTTFSAHINERLVVSPTAFALVVDVLLEKDRHWEHPACIALRAERKVDVHHLNKGPAVSVANGDFVVVA